MKIISFSVLFSSIVLLVFSNKKEEKSLNIVTHPKKIPLSHAINTLEEVVKEEKIVREFCFKHFGLSSKNEETITLASTTDDGFTTNSSTEGIEETYTIDPLNMSNCADLYNAGERTSGIYTVYLKSTIGISVYCDMISEGGAWTVFQRRGEFQKNIPPFFYRNWYRYAQGFGDLSKEFWLGNENIHLLTMQSRVKLRVELMDFEGRSAYAHYNIFEISDEKDGYKLKVGGYSGNSGDSLNYHNGKKFYTFDRDINGCARKHKSGWWFDHCLYSNLNGEYLRGEHNKSRQGIQWYHWKGSYYSLKSTEMKIRPKDFTP